jgi:hypothetical protein
MSITRDISRKALTDTAFRAQLLSDAKAAIAKEFGVKLPEAVAVRVHENSETVLHLVVDSQVDLATSRRLTGQELTQVAGGLTTRAAVTGTNTWCVRRA